MSTTQQFMGDAASPRTITHEGKTYHVRRLTDTGMEAFSAWLEEWTRSKLVRLYSHDQRMLATKLAELERDVLGGVYEFTEELVMGKEVWREEVREITNAETGEVRQVKGYARDVEGGVLHTHRGRVQLASILMGCTRDEAFALATQRSVEFGHLLDLALKESFGKQPDPWRPMSATDPNAPAGQAEEAEASGSPPPA